MFILGLRKNGCTIRMYYYYCDANKDHQRECFRDLDKYHKHIWKEIMLGNVFIYVPGGIVYLNCLSAESHQCKL